MNNDSQTSPDGTPFAIAVAGPPDRPVVQVAGEIDVATAPELRQELTRLAGGGAGAIEVDLDGVSFLDSSGLGVLLGAHKRLVAAGGQGIRITGARDTVRRVLEITGLDATFALDPAD